VIQEPRTGGATKYIFNFSAARSAKKTGLTYPIFSGPFWRQKFFFPRFKESGGDGRIGAIGFPYFSRAFRPQGNVNPACGCFGVAGGGRADWGPGFVEGDLFFLFFLGWGGDQQFGGNGGKGGERFFFFLFLLRLSKAPKQLIRLVHGFI